MIVSIMRIGVKFSYLRVARFLFRIPENVLRGTLITENRK